MAENQWVPRAKNHPTYRGPITPCFNLVFGPTLLGKDHPLLVGGFNPFEKY